MKTTVHQYYNLQPTNNLNSTVFSSLILKTWPRRSWDPMQIFLYISFDSWPYTYHSPSAKQNSMANPNPWHCYDPITIPSRNRRKKVLRLVQMMISVPGNMRRKAWLNKTRRCLEVNHPNSSLLFSEESRVLHNRLCREWWKYPAGKWRRFGRRSPMLKYPVVKWAEN